MSAAITSRLPLRMRDAAAWARQRGEVSRRADHVAPPITNAPLGAVGLASGGRRRSKATPTAATRTRPPPMPSATARPRPPPARAARRPGAAARIGPGGHRARRGSSTTRPWIGTPSAVLAASGPAVPGSSAPADGPVLGPAWRRGLPRRPTARAPGQRSQWGRRRPLVGSLAGVARAGRLADGAIGAARGRRARLAPAWRARLRGRASRLLPRHRRRAVITLAPALLRAASAGAADTAGGRAAALRLRAAEERRAVASAAGDHLPVAFAARCRRCLRRRRWVAGGSGSGLTARGTNASGQVMPAKAGAA